MTENIFFLYFCAGRDGVTVICYLQVVKNIMADPSISNESIETAVGQIVEWLKWPTAINVDQWLLCCLNELTTAQKYALMVHITEVNAEQVR